MKTKNIKVILSTIVGTGALLSPFVTTSCSNVMQHISTADVIRVLLNLRFDVNNDLIKDIQNEVNGDIDFFNNTESLDFTQLYSENDAHQVSTMTNNGGDSEYVSDIENLHDEFFKESDATSIKDVTDGTISNLQDLDVNGSHSIITNNFDKASEYAKELEEKKNGHNGDLLYGIPYALKDLIATNGITTTCGSKIFEDFKPDYNATVYQSLINSETILTGKANMDEFAMGGTGLYSSYGEVHNCLDTSRIVGGSSSGPANLTASKILPFTIGTDTSDSVRQPASYTGTVGYIGTHGIVPTFGVLPYDSFDDDLGIFTNHVADAAIVAQNIVDSSNIEDNHFFTNINEVTDIKFGVIEEVDNDNYLCGDAKVAYEDALDTIKAVGTINTIHCSDTLMKSLSPITATWDHNNGYHSFLNLRNFIYGNSSKRDPKKDKYLTKQYINKLAPQVKRRIAAGACMELPKYKKLLLGKDHKFREQWKTEWNKITNQYDAIFLPGASSVAPTIDDTKDGNAPSTPADDLIMLANIAGNPSIDIPYKNVSPYDGGSTEMPFDINLTCKPYSDQSMFNIALTLENLFNYQGD